MIPNTIEQQLAALDKIGGLDALGTAKTDNMYHAGWAWAGGTPFRYTKLVASHFGGTRNPLVISWPKGIKPDKTPRAQFHHVNDIAPTIYDILGITPPEVVNGEKQDPIDGVSMAYSFADATAPGRKTTQYFENNGSRAIYHDGFIAAAFGPLTPWLTVSPGLATWDANKDRWELYDIKKDFSEADDLAAKEPEKLAEMKKLFLKEAEANKAFPIGGGLWTRLHPEDRIKVPYTHWTFDSTTTRLPEFAAPGVGRESNRVVVDIEAGKDASGVLYALGGIGGGLSLYLDKGHLVYEYNMMMILRFIGRSSGRFGAGQASDHRRHQNRQAGRARRRRDLRRRRRDNARRGGGDRGRRLFGERDLRRRHGSRFAGVLRLFRPRAVLLHRQDRKGRCDPAMKPSDQPAG